MAIAEAELTRPIQPGMPITEDELLRLPKDGPDNPMAMRFELVDGCLFARARGTFQTGAIAANIVSLLSPFMRGRGIVSTGQDGFRMANGNIRAPDVSFTRWARIPGGRPDGGFGSAAPDLCVEIISPSERPADIARKMRDYFDSGAVYVWYVFPESQSVTVFTSPAEALSLSGGDILDGGDVLPGFSCRAAEIFAGE